MTPTTRKLLAVAEFAVCMAGPVWWTSLTVVELTQSLESEAGVTAVIAFTGAFGIGGAAWALLHDLLHEGPPSAPRVYEIMGGLIAIGCCVAVLFGLLAALWLIALPNLVTVGVWLGLFGLPLVHGVRRLRWLAGAAKPPAPRTPDPGAAHGA